MVVICLKIRTFAVATTAEYPQHIEIQMDMRLLQEK